MSDNFSGFAAKSFRVGISDCWFIETRFLIRRKIYPTFSVTAIDSPALLSRTTSVPISPLPLLHIRQHVRIHIQGQGDAGVAEAFVDDFRVFTRLQQQRRAGVPQIVQTNRFVQPRLPQGRFEMALCQVLQLQRRSQVRTKYQIVVVPFRAEQ